MDTGHVNTVSTTEEENSSKGLVGVKSFLAKLLQILFDILIRMGAYVNDKTRPAAAHNNFKRSSKLQPTTTNYIESLPDDVVFDILVRVPAQDIHNAVRLVCHKWYQTTRTRDFVRAHLQQSSSCGLVVLPYGSQRNLFATQKGPIIERSHFDYKFKGDFFTSCNGLVLERDRITNPATKKHLDLPTFSSDDVAWFYNSAIAYAVASKEYKAVCPFFSNSVVLECAILTVGVDEDWKRRADIRHLSRTAKNLLTQPPLSTQGFVHWAHNGSSRFSEYVLTLNVETEIITQFPAVPPTSCGETELLYRYLPMGSCLSLLTSRASEPFPIWDQVWVMKPETGEWTKMMSIDSESQKRAFQGVSAALNLRPVGWLKFREVFVFGAHGSSSCIAYNVRTHEIESFELGFNPYNFFAHKNSLLWLDGC